MKLVAIVLVLSAVLLCKLRVEEAMAQDRHLAETQQQSPGTLPAGSCMPIGLTARGEIVFPWECRELIEKQRGPVSEGIPSPPKDSVAKEEAPSPNAEPEPVIATPALSSAPTVTTTEDQQSERRLNPKKSARPHQQKKRVDTALQPDARITGAIK